MASKNVEIAFEVNKASTDLFHLQNIPQALPEPTWQQIGCGLTLIDDFLY